MDPATNPNLVGSWVLIAFAVAAGVGTLLQIVAFFKPKPGNHEVYATKSELGALKGDIERQDKRHADENNLLHKRISKLRDEIASAGDARAKLIIEEIHLLRADMKEDLEGAHSRITDAEKLIERVDERTKR